MTILFENYGISYQMPSFELQDAIFRSFERFDEPLDESNMERRVKIPRRGHLNVS